MDPEHELIRLSPAALIWHDVKGERNLEDWRSAIDNPSGDAAARITAPDFSSMDPSQQPLGRRDGAIWVAVRLDNPHVQLLRHLEVAPARLEVLDAWLISGSASEQAHYLGRSGLSVKLADRPLESHMATWALTVPPGKSTILLRIQSRTALQPEIALWQPKAHATSLRRTDLRQGIEAGTLALTALLTLVFSLWLREPKWAWYSLASLSLLLYQTSFNGQAVLWLWPDHPQWTLPALALGIACTHVSVAMFFLSFVERSSISAAVRIGALVLAGTSVFGLLLVWFVKYESGVKLQELVGLTLPLAMPWLAWRAWQLNDKPSRFLLLSFALLSVASVMRVAMVYGWLPLGAWLEDWLMPGGSVLTSCVLMLAMADRIRLLVQQQALAAAHHQATLESRIHQATSELVLARDEAQAAARFKQRFLSRVSHDLRTPLHTLIGNAVLAREILSQMPGTPGHSEVNQQLQEAVLAVERSSSDVLQLSNELLELARGEAGQLRLKTGPASLATLVQDVARTARWLALHQNNQLRIETELSVPWVVLDADRVRQVLHNLLANACVATRDGVITLGMRSAPDPHNPEAQVELWVADTGRGIAPEALPRIFEPFEQIDADKATGSAGLGLAIAQQWVQLMGGKIAVQSTVDVGSRFSWSIRVPTAIAPTGSTDKPLHPPGDDTRASLPLRPEQADVSPPLQGRVLIVDDRQDHRLLLQGLLHDMGLQVSQATCGHAAVSLLQGQPIDLVITDQNMPDGDGLSLLQWCRQHRPSAAVVVLSGELPPQDGFDACLLKPVNTLQLRPVLQRLLPPALDWAPLRQLAEHGDGLGVDAWIARHRHKLGSSPLARGTVELGQSLQLAALVRWLAAHELPARTQPTLAPP
jgi:signal transduction histidine kinase